MCTKVWLFCLFTSNVWRFVCVRVSLCLRSRPNEVGRRRPKSPHAYAVLRSSFRRLRFLLVYRFQFHEAFNHHRPPTLSRDSSGIDSDPTKLHRICSFVISARLQPSRTSVRLSILHDSHISLIRRYISPFTVQHSDASYVAGLVLNLPINSISILLIIP